MFRHSLTLTFFFFLGLINVFAQKSHIKQGSVWYRYQLNLQLPKDIKLKTEAEERTWVAPVLKQHQFYVRSVAGKEFKSKWFVGLGFAYFANGANDAINTSKLIASEFRPFLEISAKQRINSRFAVNHRYKIEGRFQQKTNAAYTERLDGYNKSCRFRYQLGLEYSPFQKDEKEIKLKLADEIMINAGKSVGKNIFDQNRVITAFQYNFNKKIGIELSYIFWLQQLSSGDKMYNRHIMRITFINNFSISKKVKPE
ncbi:MAG TPA: DUF2490 domain-containing protein [Chitinophagales bacterium]|nr:DUF2490 domain-containing protein [Chitinophagales bacterium]HNL85387.1 DUF2490 domain-containing protein [Chitinophagales bacterium]